MKQQLRSNILIIFTAISLSLPLLSQAQAVFENPKHQVYEFLSRQAQKGNIDFRDLIQPITRKQIAEQLAVLQENVTKLSVTEQKELTFYQKEFAEFNTNLKDTTTFFKKDQAGRWRFLSVKKDGFLLNGDPSLSLTGTASTPGNRSKWANGLEFWGHAGSHFAFQFSFQDNTERGKGIDSLRIFTSETGVVKTESLNAKSLNYSNFRGHISYAWSNGLISVGQDQLTYGYGENGRVVLSDKAPAYPMIRLDYHPLKWLSFNYTHAFLQSGIIDSTRTYNKGNDTFGNYREAYIPKFMASHSLTFFPTKGLSLSVGESMVYSDRFDAGYLIPIMFFKVYDQYASRYKITTGSNGQFFLQASSRDHLKNTHLYSTLFIDEIRLGDAFNSAKSRNQIGFNIGGSVTDAFVPYLTFGAEYTRINPFAYQNLIPAQNYTSQKYVLGDWMGANADRLMGYIKYTPLARLKTSLYVQHTRKGDPGSLLDQYFAIPQPAFLSTVLRADTQVQFKASYEWFNNLYVEGNVLWNTEKNIL
ncbi:MAG: hypothetical protein EOO88_23035, partial [Pedobacter sp.]